MSMQGEYPNQTVSILFVAWTTMILAFSEKGIPQYPFQVLKVLEGLQVAQPPSETAS